MGSFRQLTTPKAMLILLPIGLGLAIYSGWRMIEEDRLFADAIEVDAEVLGGRVVDSVTGSGRNRNREYRPEVHFRYTLGQKTYESRRVTPLDHAGSRSWAQELVARFPAGSKVRAFAVPGEPGSAYLLKIRGWKPPVGLGIGSLLVLLTGFGLWRRGVAVRRMAREAAEAAESSPRR